MSKYMLILHDNPQAFAEYSPEQMQAVVERYTAWARQLAESGRHAGGNKLTDEGGRHLRRVDGRLSAVDGPYAEAKEVIGGYFLVNAADMAEAEAIARDCPHLDYDGRIEIRQVDEIGADHE